MLPGSPAGAAASLLFGGKAQLQKLQLPSALCERDAQTPGACCCCWGGLRRMGGLGCPIQELLQGLRGLPAARMAGEEARKHGGGVWRQLLVWPWSRFLGKLTPTATGASRPSAPLKSLAGLAPLCPFCPVPSLVSLWGCVPEHSWGSAQKCSSLQLCACRRMPQRALGCRGGTFLLLFPAFSVPVRWQSRRKSLSCASFSVLGEQGDRGGPSWWQHPARGGFCRPGSGSPLSFLCNLFVFGPSKTKQGPGTCCFASKFPISTPFCLVGE